MIAYTIQLFLFESVHDAIFQILLKKIGFDGKV